MILTGSQLDETPFVMVISVGSEQVPEQVLRELNISSVQHNLSEVKGVNWFRQFEFA